MVQQRKKASSSTKTTADAPLVKDLADPAPFFALGAAHFNNAIVVTKVVSVVLPLRHLRDRTILHEMVLKKLLHRTFEPSTEDLAQQPQQVQPRDATLNEQTASTPATLSTSSPSPAEAVYVIVHIASVEIHADTARQINPQGDVQVNVMTTLVAARVQHGLIAGIAEASAFATCMQVRLPTVRVSAEVAAANQQQQQQQQQQSAKSDAEALALQAVKLEGDSQETESAGAPPALSSGASSPAVDQQLRVTARCLEDEPVVPGQAVLLVSEPAAMRCLAIRPPRDAPGPFFFAADAVVDASGVAVKKAKTTARRAGRRGTSATTAKEEERRVVVVDCDVPESAKGGKGEAARKRPRS